jgi:hypothetical protein
MSKQEILWAALERELARQDMALEEARATLASFGDCEIGVAEELLQQIDEACMVRVPSLPIMGLRV